MSGSNENWLEGYNQLIKIIELSLFTCSQHFLWTRCTTVWRKVSQGEVACLDRLSALQKKMEIKNRPYLGQCALTVMANMLLRCRESCTADIGHRVTFSITIVTANNN